MKSKFITRPGIVPLIDGKNFVLDSDLVAELEDGRKITVPAGFKTDLASIPPLGVLGGVILFVAFWLPHGIIDYAIALIGFLICMASAYLKAYGKYTYAAITHDWIFQTHFYSFTVCNWILLILMRAEKTAKWERFLIWFNVQAFGYGIYKSDKRISKNWHLHPRRTVSTDTPKII